MRTFWKGIIHVFLEAHTHNVQAVYNLSLSSAVHNRPRLFYTVPLHAHNTTAFLNLLPANMNIEKITPSDAIHEKLRTCVGSRS